eukprot:TRINITY_DN58107_c0_g3_i1.p1 TRINITY_DN58107_c0_g3~~TRINITY_DN58107_c0_g3_i1.p1  ORF type:complete len:2786 (-),score=679.57 TRINITY_DN58107_c0_g3_i1:252-8609(-)
MPGGLAYFCSEWRRGRRLVQLDSEVLFDLAFDLGGSIDGDGNVFPGSRLAQQYDLQGWCLDVDEAVKGNILTQSAGDEHEGSSCSVMSSVAPVLSPQPPLAAHPSGATIPLSSANSTLSRFGRLRATANASLSNTSAFSGTATASLSKTRTLSDKCGANPQVLFVCPGHCLSDWEGTFQRDEFVSELRRRLVPERYFAPRPHNKEDVEPVFSSEEGEELFSCLALLQRAGDKQQVHMGRLMDTLVDNFLIIAAFRQVVERSAPSVGECFQRLDLDKDNIVELRELEQFVKSHDGLVDLTSYKDASTFAQLLFAALDSNRDRKIHLKELRRQLALAAPCRLSITELGTHLELRYGVGKCGMSGQVEFPQFFNHLTKEESLRLDISLMDAARVFRQAQALDKYKRGSAVLGSTLENLFRDLPLEATWGVEPHFAEQTYCALGLRILTTARSFRLDSGMPEEAIMFHSVDEEAPPEEAPNRRGSTSEDFRQYLDNNFSKLWDMHLSSPAVDLTSQTAHQLKGACQQRYHEAANAVLERWKQIEQRAGKTPPKLGPRCLFPNIGDVICTSTTRLYSGQGFVVRYRLTGGSNYWHPEHTVQRNEREAFPFPGNRRLLGDTPFIGLVPRGLNWTSAGGGGFYFKNQAFTKVDASLRADLPCEKASGQLLLYGQVTLIAPSLERTARSLLSAGEDASSLLEEFEVRLFCSTKNKIVGCIGEPLPVTVMHKALPPPLESLQVRLEGRNATLRWGMLPIGPQISKTAAECIRINMRSDKSERTFSLEPSTSELDVQDLSPDTEYEFRARMENRAGIGREVCVACRTNACCSTPSLAAPIHTETTSMKLRFTPPKVVGHEGTKDKWQQGREAILCYQAVLKVKSGMGEKTAAGDDDEQSHQMQQTTTGASDAAVASLGGRLCKWTQGQWQEDREGVVLKLNGLRPDTKYTLDELCAVNSMGPGSAAKGVVLWTLPQVPRISHVRVRHNNVLIALSQAGGLNVKEYNVQSCLTKKPSAKIEVKLQQTTLSHTHDGYSEFPELSIPFEKFPAAENVYPFKEEEKHTFLVQAINPGGTSEWSKEHDSTAVTRQQGAQEAQLALERAIEAHRIGDLERVLEDVRDLELPDQASFELAKQLLQRLKGAHDVLTHWMKVKNPVELKSALEKAREVDLADSYAEALELLEHLERVVQLLAEAKGIAALKEALNAANEVGLPHDFVKDAIARLGSREATQHNLEQAMSAARVQRLQEALDAAEGMHLPSEAEARRLLGKLQFSESLLHLGIESRLIADLETALDDVAASGLREDGLIGEAQELLRHLVEEREAAYANLLSHLEIRHPPKLRKVFLEAKKAQVPEAKLREAAEVLEGLEHLMRKLRDAFGLEKRKKTLEKAREAKIPAELLQEAEEQHLRLGQLQQAMKQGGVEVMRLALKRARRAGVKEEEMKEADEAYKNWSTAGREVEDALALQQSFRLRAAIATAVGVGIAEEQLEAAKRSLEVYEKRDGAELVLQCAMQHRKAEQLLNAIKQACEVEVSNRHLMEEAHSTLERLYQLRIDAAATIELHELRTAYSMLQEAKREPALPDVELEKLRSVLKREQTKEFDFLVKWLKDILDGTDFRVADTLILRALYAKEAGVVLSETLCYHAAELSLTRQEALQMQHEEELQKERGRRKYLKLPEQLPEEVHQVAVPAHTVTGEINVTWQPSGVHLCILPREIVEATLSLLMEEETLDQGGPSGAAAEHNIQSLMKSLRDWLPEEDTFLELTEEPHIIDDEAQLHRRISGIGLPDGRLQRDFAVYVRGEHTSMDVVKEIITMKPEPEMVKDEPDILSAQLTQALARSVVSDDGEVVVARRPRQRHLAKHVKDVRARFLRRVTLEFSWEYPRGLLDNLDCTCFVFHTDHLIDVLDHRGAHGAKYGAFVRRGQRAEAGTAEAVFGAVRHSGDMVDSGKRCGKQVMQVRLDLLPERVSDLIFVLSTYNSRDLSKFANIRVDITDTDTSRLFATFTTQTVTEAQGVVMCNIYRESEDGLWRISAFGTATKGTSRDYRPMLRQLSRLGFPRHVNMKGQVPELLKAIQKGIKLPHEVKANIVEFAESSSMRVQYTAEVFKGAWRADEILAELSSLSLQENVAAALRSVNSLKSQGGQHDFGARFANEHIVFDQAAIKLLSHLEVHLIYDYPAAERFKGTVCLEGAVLLYEQQSCRELVDYRGAHGIRVVHNGVVDYGGIWLGVQPVTDASGGSVTYESSELDDARGTGRETFRIDLNLLPHSVSDLFFVLSTTSRQALSQFTNIRVRIVDAENPAHELTSQSLATANLSGQAVLACSLNRVLADGALDHLDVDVIEEFGGSSSQLLAGAEDLQSSPLKLYGLDGGHFVSGDQSTWRLHMFGSSLQGNCKDYRPTMVALRAFQAAQDTLTKPNWPSKEAKQRGKELGATQQIRLPRHPDVIVPSKRIKSVPADGTPVVKMGTRGSMAAAMAIGHEISDAPALLGVREDASQGSQRDSSGSSASTLSALDQESERSDARSLSPLSDIARPMSPVALGIHGALRRASFSDNSSATARSSLQSVDDVPLIMPTRRPSVSAMPPGVPGVEGRRMSAESIVMHRKSSNNSRIRSKESRVSENYLSGSALSESESGGYELGAGGSSASPSAFSSERRRSAHNSEREGGNQSSAAAAALTYDSFDSESDESSRRAATPPLKRRMSRELSTHLTGNTFLLGRAREQLDASSAAEPKAHARPGARSSIIGGMFNASSDTISATVSQVASRARRVSLFAAVNNMTSSSSDGASSSNRR